MNDWSTRPFEERNLFNPAFCALVLASALRAYQKTAKAPMPYSLSLLILPLCLHQGTRNEICNNKVSILRIISRHPELLIDFSGRARSLIRFAMEAFALLASRNCIAVSSDGGISLIRKKVSDKPLATGDAELCRTAAAQLGRDFARIKDPVTIYTSLSIRP